MKNPAVGDGNDQAEDDIDERAPDQVLANFQGHDHQRGFRLISRHAGVAEHLGNAAGQHLPFHHHENHDEHHQNPVPEPAIAIARHHPENVGERLPFRQRVLEITEDARIFRLAREEFILVGQVDDDFDALPHQLIDPLLTVGIAQIGYVLQDLRDGESQVRRDQKVQGHETAGHKDAGKGPAESEPPAQPIGCRPHDGGQESREYKRNEDGRAEIESHDDGKTCQEIYSPAS